MVSRAGGGRGIVHLNGSNFVSVMLRRKSFGVDTCMIGYGYLVWEIFNVDSSRFSSYCDNALVPARAGAQILMEITYSAILLL